MDQNQFPSFYRDNVKRVYRFLYYRLNGNKERAEDLTQDVFLKALAAFESYDPRISQVSWIITIARNHLINQLQKDRPTLDIAELEETLWDQVDLLEKMSLSFDETRLLSALSQLPSEEAEIIRLKYLESWPYEEIAHKMGKTAGALRIQAYRALKQLKGLLKQK